MRDILVVFERKGRDRLALPQVVTDIKSPHSVFDIVIGTVSKEANFC